MIIVVGGNNLSDHRPLIMTLKMSNISKLNACKSHNIDRLRWYKSDLNSYENAHNYNLID